ncbi:MAG: flagellar basal body P-ring formation chaperone FlgA [Devosia sp.]|nr:flagellar basal body P-ring formation chaperone FlgA [Devosia sp.]
MNNKLVLAVALTMAACGGAHAAPVLRADITVISEIVTVGDMFDDAGVLAEKALFRAPLPGTTGMVSLDAVREAARLVGLTDFENEGVARVRVARAAAMVDARVLTELITRDLMARGIADGNMTVQASFDTPDLAFNAEAVTVPAQLVNLRYMPSSGGFAARFLVAGRDLPVDVTGRLKLMVEAPHLATSLPSGAILQASDIEMKLVPLKFAETAGIARLDQLVGKQLQRQSRSGLMLRAADMADPLIVQRNSHVTVYLRSGPMTLTVKGQALNAASVGQPVQVLNLASKRILHGVAMANGSVNIASTLDVAGL